MKEQAVHSVRVFCSSLVLRCPRVLLAAVLFTDDAEQQILQVFSARSRPLSACRKDSALKAKEPALSLAMSRPPGS